MQYVACINLGNGIFEDVHFTKLVSLDLPSPARSLSSLISVSTETPIRHLSSDDTMDL